VDDLERRHADEIKNLVCDLPNGVLVPILLKEEFTNSLLQMETLQETMAIIKEVTYRKVEIEYVLAFFEFETQRIYNN
jgi:tRNA A-37 threonylcarbamoyl transferase component Bud32